MFRKDSITIEEWIKNSNKALLVTGARQIGKTWLIRDEIEKSGYTKFEINFIDPFVLQNYLKPNKYDWIPKQISYNLKFALPKVALSKALNA